ncbi:MAG TPA: glycosyltransferase family 2 protein [Candidatus Polarisedimenticolia bacterium]|nr:glycosyltransferase family 2 protein [Candidatus Polarisedimenticolia bacterium]
MRVSVVIPAAGEAAVLAPVLEKCRPHADEILVVDGTSGDGTRAIAERHGARVVPEEGGEKGAGLRRAFDLVRGDIVVLLDADGSHDPGDIPKLIAPIVAGQAEYCIASRRRGGSDALCATVPQLVRSVGEQVFTFAVNRRFGLRLTDAQNGFRAVLGSALRRLNLRDHGAAIGQEITIQSIRRGLRVMEIPIHGHAPAGDAGPGLWRTAPGTVLSVLRHLFRTSD